MHAAGIAEIEWAVEPSRAGPPVLEIGGRRVHSRYDPLAEAGSLARAADAAMRERRADALILIGVGLGYLPEALRRLGRSRLLLWDPFPRLTASLPAGSARAGDFPRVHGPEGFAGQVARLARQGARPHVIVHPGHEEICRFEARFAARELRRAFAADRSLRPEEAVVSRRSIDAILRLPGLATIAALEGALAGRTAIVAAPGPSLERALPALARRRTGVVIAAVQALRPLVEAGVRVDIAVAPDPREYSPYLEGVEGLDDVDRVDEMESIDGAGGAGGAERVDRVRGADGWKGGRLNAGGPGFGALLADTAADPGLLDRFRERCFLFHLRAPHLHHVVWEACGLPVIDEPFVSVSETALVLAHRLGARRFVLAGVDLCSESDRYPVRFRTRDAAGRPVWTNSTYFHAARYLDALCPALERDGCDLRRAGDGLPLSGTRAIEPEELDALLGRSPEPPLALPGASGAADTDCWRIARDVLRAARDAGAGGAGTAGAGALLGPSGRSDPTAALPANERQRALHEALEALERRTLRGPSGAAVAHAPGPR